MCQLADATFNVFGGMTDDATRPHLARTNLITPINRVPDVLINLNSVHPLGCKGRSCLESSATAGEQLYCTFAISSAVTNAGMLGLEHQCTMRRLVIAFPMWLWL
jgi:hypothetical protein